MFSITGYEYNKTTKKVEESSVNFKAEHKATNPSSRRCFVYIIKGSTFLCVFDGIMGSVAEYYIVPKNVYDTCYSTEETLQEKIDKLPKSAQVKVKKILDFLPENIKNENLIDLAGLSYTLFQYLNYASRGKNRPSDWDSFIPYLASVPQSVFCEKVRIGVKKYKRKHGAKLH